MNKPIYLLIWSALIMVCFTSCVKDTDFDQADDIVLSPVLELDFIYFTLGQSDYFNSNTGEERLVVTDTTDFEILNESFVRDDLKRAEYLFELENSAAISFLTEFRYLNEMDEVVYEIAIPISAGSIAAPELTEHIENIETQGIIELTQASKIVVNVIIPSSFENIEGALNLQSKTTYFFEI